MYYVLYLITVPDIMETETVIQRLAFEHKEDCLYLAHILKQELDPIAQKQQCQDLEEYKLSLRLPLPKPEGML
mgnify:FL=1